MEKEEQQHHQGAFLGLIKTQIVDAADEIEEYAHRHQRDIFPALQKIPSCLFLVNNVRMKIIIILTSTTIALSVLEHHINGIIQSHRGHHPDFL